MYDLTADLLKYRECARLVWNLCLREYTDGEREFLEVDSALFKAILVSQIEAYEEPRRIGDRDFYGRLEVLTGGDRETDVLRGQDVGNGVKWSAHRWRPGSASLRYRSLFDFGTVSGEWREFKYVEAIVVAVGNDPALDVGRRVLLEVDEIRLMDISPTRE